MPVTSVAAPVTSLPNIGPAMAAWFERAGIPDAAALRRLGAESGYAGLLTAGMRPHFIGYLAVAMALEGRSWTDCSDEEKRRLRRRFDAIVAAYRAVPTGIEGALDAIGVRADDALSDGLG